MKVKCKEVLNGIGPSERIAIVDTVGGGDEEVVVQDTFIIGDYLEVFGIATRDDATLIELPQESTTGNWRIWVPVENLMLAE